MAQSSLFIHSFGENCQAPLVVVHTLFLGLVCSEAVQRAQSKVNIKSGSKVARVLCGPVFLSLVTVARCSFLFALVCERVFVSLLFVDAVDLRLVENQRLDFVRVRGAVK